eukprot:3036738-Rhodomonas_salina.1
MLLPQYQTPIPRTTASVLRTPYHTPSQIPSAVPDSAYARRRGVQANSTASAHVPRTLCTSDARKGFDFAGEQGGLTSSQRPRRQSPRRCRAPGSSIPTLSTGQRVAAP